MPGGAAGFRANLLSRKRAKAASAVLARAEKALRASLDAPLEDQENRGDTHNARGAGEAASSLLERAASGKTPRKDALDEMLRQRKRKAGALREAKAGALRRSSRARTPRVMRNANSQQSAALHLRRPVPEQPAVNTNKHE